ncbi:hypothetical protein OOU_Y34scaffold00065g3 [Pyricularia oryzae Y34]|uniref:Uncharacterized protein n=2 Tax=Pyricularia oryzae TaxID=318829 RepID=A0AA97P9S7_PYRO3|nr:hypothetical protein OOU_Y34scaffold00065g3 [Pyricularia oryzae Y34]
MRLVFFHDFLKYYTIWYMNKAVKEV